ncbi:hypothetical protein [Shewanella algae]|uniref:hypothetical protein n=1 Tax=Shewanella algae TaxID=38313 RepID=UPI001C57B6A6|nr:hypothetical protein [Shewanella algae]
MAEKMTQGQALLAVLAGGIRRKREYIIETALRSSLYGILDDRDGVVAGQVSLPEISARILPVIDDSVTASMVGIDEITLRTTQVKFEELSAQINSSMVGIDEISLRVVLIKYDEAQLHQVSAGQVGADEITLTVA